MAEYNGKTGVWRTVGGRRIFIVDGEDLASAMKRSGKFTSKKDIEHQKRKINNELIGLTGEDKKRADEEYDAYDKLSKENDKKYNTESAIPQKMLDNAVELNEIAKRTGKSDFFSEAGKKWNKLYKEDKNNIGYDLKDGYKASIGYNGGIQISSNHAYNDTKYSYAKANIEGGKIKDWTVTIPGNGTEKVETVSEVLNTMKTADKWIDSGEKVRDYEGVTTTRKPKVSYQNYKKDRDEYALYKKAKLYPDSIDPMTENSTDWGSLEKKYSERFNNDPSNNFSNTRDYNMVQLDYDAYRRRLEQVEYKINDDRLDSMKRADYRKERNDIKLKMQNLDYERNRAIKNEYNQYKKEHPNTDLTYEDYKKIKRGY